MMLLKKQSSSGLLMGAVPFDDSAEVHLFVPEQIYRAGPIEKCHVTPKAKGLSKSQCFLHMIPDPGNYMQGVEQALERIQRSELLKVVLSRSPGAVIAGGA